MNINKKYYNLHTYMIYFQTDLWGQPGSGAPGSEPHAATAPSGNGWQQHEPTPPPAVATPAAPITDHHR